jgi:hypothetical protein
VTVPLKELEDIPLPLAFGGICHFLKRANYIRSYTNRIMQMVD